MAPSTSLIAVAGAAVLVVAVGALALRGPDAEEPDAGASEASTTTDAAAPEATSTQPPPETEATETETTEAEPTGDAASTDAPTATPLPTETATAADDPTGAPIALGPDGVEIEDTPRTGGGSLAALGAAVAAGAVAAGRRHDG